MATKAKKRAATTADTSVTEDQVVHDLDASVVADLDDDESFFQDIDLLQNHGIVSYYYKLNV